jgi:uncharacterized membrane protein
MQVESERQPSVDGQRERTARVQEQHQGTSWAHSANLVLGAWLIASAFTFGYGDPELVEGGAVRITAERQLPSVAFRGETLFWSDVLSGALLLVFAGLSLSRSHVWAPWAAGGVGLWLLFAPLVLWAPTAASYGNDTLVGALVIAFALLIPGVPGLQSPPGPEAPPGWNYNPSAWLQRTPIIAFAFVGFFISRYLAAYQLGHLPAIWDPFFPDGTRRVLDSEVSLAWPISDAGLGAISYLLEALTGFLGDARRWRTMPWMVIVFGILVVPLGVVSIVLVILQPLAVGAWCTLCLVTAAAMLVMIAPALDEVIATGQFLLQSQREGKPFWRTFWKGGTLEGYPEDTGALRRGSPLAEMAHAVGLTNVPWNLVVSATLGVWLMAAPAVFGTHGTAAGSDQLIGALIVTFAVIAIGEVARAARFLNLLFGAWLVAAPWLLPGATPAAQWNDVAVGGALLLLSLPRGKVTEHFGSWDRYVV